MPPHRRIDPRTDFQTNPLKFLRAALDESSTTDTQQKNTLPLLRYLRQTLWLPMYNKEVDLAAVLCLPNTFTEHVVLGDGWEDTDRGDSYHDTIVATLCAMPCLTALDLRGYCCETYQCAEPLLLPLSQAHPKLRRLYLHASFVRQECLDRFTFLKELSVSCCRMITNVHFCAQTLRVLLASQSSIDDEGLRNAKHLEVLDISGTTKVTTVAPFAATLRELSAGGDCGITDTALADAKYLLVLQANSNPRVTTVVPFARTLRDLSASTDCGISGSVECGLHLATELVRLNAFGNGKVTVVPPNLRELRASSFLGPCGITDKALLNTTKLVSLDACGNKKITSVKPFTSTLRSLEASNSGIDIDAIKETLLHDVSIE